MYTIFCDMDGVIVDFERGYYELTGKHTSQVLDGSNEFWKPLEDEGALFWATLPWMPDGKQLWDYIKKYKPYILTAPSLDSSSRVGKEAWCKNYILKQQDINQILLMKIKYLLTIEKTLLQVGMLKVE